MKHLFSLLLLGGVCFLHAGQAPNDLAMMQGVWQVVSLHEKGEAAAPAEVAALEVTISSDKFVVNEKGKLLVDYTIKLDPTKSPKAIDFTHAQGENKGKVEPGIYAFDKGFLKLILDEDKKGRPRTFEGKETASYSVMVLKRKAK